VPKLVLDPKATTIVLRTFAEGIFARLAHDLELACRGVEGAAETSADGGSATLVIPITRIDVRGTLKDGRVDEQGLSPSDREDCLGKMRRDVFHVEHGDVRVEATLESSKGDKARVRVVPPKGRPVERTTSVKVERRDDGSIRVTGSVPISLEAIGSSTVKGPMNAFRVKDEVEVRFDVVFVVFTQPAAQPA
jgi:hypothetical protein